VRVAEQHIFYEVSALWVNILIRCRFCFGSTKIGRLVPTPVPQHWLKLLLMFALVYNCRYAIHSNFLVMNKNINIFINSPSFQANLSSFVCTISFIILWYYYLINFVSAWNVSEPEPHKNYAAPHHCLVWVRIKKLIFWLSSLIKELTLQQKLFLSHGPVGKTGQYCAFLNSTVYLLYTKVKIVKLCSVLVAFMHSKLTQISLTCY
jgi:hypothetical protein